MLSFIRTRHRATAGSRSRSGVSFDGDTSGIAAVEFALILPLMLLIYLGGFDVMRMVRADDKIENAARLTADLTAQEPTVKANPASDIATILQAATGTAAPFNDTRLTITVSAIDLTSSPASTVTGVASQSSTCCTATVRWSVTQGGVLRPCSPGQNANGLNKIDDSTPWAVNTIPKTIADQKLIPGLLGVYASSVIVVDVSYAYSGVSPVISGLLDRTIWRHSYSIPRLAGQVVLASSDGLSAGMTGVVCPSS